MAAPQWDLRPSLSGVKRLLAFDGVQLRANDLAGNDQFNAAVLLAALARLVRSHGDVKSPAYRCDRALRDSLSNEEFANRCGSLLRKGLIEFSRTDVVGVTLGFQPKVGVVQDNASQPGQLLASQRAQRVLAGIKLDIRHVHY